VFVNICFIINSLNIFLFEIRCCGLLWIMFLFIAKKYRMLVYIFISLFAHLIIYYNIYITFIKYA